MIVSKVTTGFVTQRFDTSTQEWLDQQFIAGDECEYEDWEGNPVDPADELPTPEPYLRFEMKQPSEMK